MPRRPQLSSQSGSALITALIVMSVSLVLGIAALATVDSQQHESAFERQRDEAFNTSEAALNSQIYMLSSRWPACTLGATCASAAYPTSCTVNSVSPDCPSTSALQGTYAGSKDFDASATWTTQVRDNDVSTPQFYSDSLLSSAATYDANGDGFLWVRSTAVVKGHRRTLVALVKAEQTTQNFPHHTLVAGWFKTTNSGNKVIIDNQGTAGYPSEAVVRCAPAGTTPPVTGCADYSTSKGQVNPNRVVFDPSQPPAMSPDALDSLRAQAKAEGNYYATCAGSSLQGSSAGQIVFIEDATGGGCNYNGNSNFNTAAAPGTVVIGKGSITINGGATFYGVLYNANLDNETGALVNLGGNCSINGSIVVDGSGGINAGSSKVNLVWDPNVFNNLKAFGTAGIVQNTFREISATS